MSIDVHEVTDAERWNDLVAQAEQRTPFHRYESLRVQREYADATLHPLVAHKGEEPVGLFPVFTVSKGPITAAFSPPPDLKVEYLGPIQLNSAKLKRRKRDRRNERTVEAYLAWLDERFDPKFYNVRTTVDYEDARPFVWRNFDVTPRYTYHVDLTVGVDDLFSRFSSDARRNVRADHDHDYEITEGGAAAIERIVAQVRERYAQQDVSFPLPAGFVTDLSEALPDGVIRPYVCEVGGDFVGGIVVVEFACRTYSWLGGVTPSIDLPVNDLLDWRLCRDAIDRDNTVYDLVGANDERLYRYKAKFAPQLATYYRIQRGTWSTNLASKLYRRFR